MKRFRSVAVGFAALLLATAAPAQTLHTWLTDADRNILFQQQPDLSFGKNGPVDSLQINVDGSKKYQSIDGFGFALTGGSAQHLLRMSAPRRAALLQELFGRKANGIGTSYLRISIGASDLNDHVFSYDDLEPGQTDTDLVHFDLGPDKREVIPVLKEILAINPKLKILGSPWSPPTWMKDNHDTRGGSLLPAYYASYARYFVHYIRAMAAEGIRIDAITVQNEPLHPGNNPSLLMPAAQQGEFVKNHLGPAFRDAHINTKIIIYDHNADRPDYPLSILSDEDAAQYIDGSAFHLYGGEIGALSAVHDAFPRKNLYFTEQWVGAPGHYKKDIGEHIDKLIVGATRNWCRTVIEWNLAADSHNQPHTDRGGCDRCLGAVTIDGDSVKRNPAYYIIAHAAKWVIPGSVRVATEANEMLPNVAFRTPEGKTVLIVLNKTRNTHSFTIGTGKKQASVSLAAGAVGTYVW
jgi:glucosylceramidase